MRKVLIIAGPTATGKSAFAVQCAKVLDGEIINGDSQQVYRQLSIGTAKITDDQKQGVPHHLLDILEYSQPYNVADFQKAARAAIEDIASRGKLPILCGGSGHYLKAVLYDYDFKSDPVSELTYDELNDQERYDLLLSIDPLAAKKIHMNNRKRVIRAINLGLSGPLKSEREAAQNHEPIYDCFMVVMTVERDLLNQRIEKRVQAMKDQGLIEEVNTFFSSKEAQSFQSFLGIGYKEFRGFLNGTETAETAIQLIVTHTRQFAKRQLTWFRHQFEARWVNALDPSDLNQVQDEIRLWQSQEKP